jgi:N-acetylglucosaminyl-diphospho-decaprenol L-rhamnosyltransferase
MNARVDVVVVSYNSRDTLRDCVAPLAEVDGVDVTIVDNGSADRSLETIADLRVRAIESGRNGGFGFGCNLGMASGSAPYVLFLNPDAQLEPAVLDAEPDVAIVGPRVLDDDGRLFPSQRRYQRAGSTWAQAFFLHRPLWRAAWANEIIRQDCAYERPAYPEWLSGACMLARRDVVEDLRGFDEGFFLYCEDMDLCARVRAAGHRIRYEPGATVRHKGGHSAPRASLYAILARSRMRFASLHAGRARARLQYLGLAVGALTHVAASIGRPARARGHAEALLAILGRGTA